MLKNKVLIGGLVGGVVFFLLGWLVYGIIMMEFMSANMNQCAMLPMEQMVWWAIILSNFAYAFLLAVLIGRTKSYGFVSGSLLSATIGMLMGISIDFGQYSMTTMFTGGLTALLVDIVVTTVFAAIGGGIIGAVMGMGKKPDQSR